MPWSRRAKLSGQDGHRVLAIPHEELRTVLKEYNRLQ
jgi:hypothetical protein